MNKSNKKRNRYLLAAVAIVVIIVILVKLNSNKNDTKDTTKSSNSTKIANIEDEKSTEAVENSVTKNEIDEDTKKEINKLLDIYYDTSKETAEEIAKETVEETVEEKAEEKAESVVEKREGIEAHKSRVTQIKAGIEKDTYIVFSKYDMKFYNIDTLAPGMSILYVVKGQDGTFSIISEPYSEDINAYIEGILKEEEIQNTINEVNQGLVEAMNKDEELKDFVEKLEKATKTESETKTKGETKTEGETKTKK